MQTHPTPGRAVAPALRLALLVTADAAALATLRPDPGALGRGLAAPHRWVSTEGADRAALVLAEAALWGVAAWLAAGVLVTLAGSLPGSLGRAAERASRSLAPEVLRRFVAAAAGFGVLVAPATADAIGSGHAAHAGALPRPLPVPAWPTDAPLPAPSWPTTASATGSATPSATPAATASATPAATAAAARQTTSPNTSPAPSGTVRPNRAAPSPHDVVVRPGDSLWLISARHLGPDAPPAAVAAEWPRWFAANRAEIGADPGLIRPGQVLRTPADADGSRP